MHPKDGNKSRFAAGDPSRHSPYAMSAPEHARWQFFRFSDDFREEAAKLEIAAPP